jgi:ABC-type Fe3+ transport system permease subunit
MNVLAVVSTSTTGWTIGYTIGIIVVVVVVALVVPILMLARKIGNEAKLINDSLTKSVANTAALAGLNTTIKMAVNVIEGLQRGRKRLGG